MTPALLLLIGLFLWLLGLGLFLHARRLRRAGGLPPGEIIYVDTGNWRRSERPLFSKRYLLTGKPDYLVRSGHQTIPVEVKSSRLRRADPYDSHKLQLAAYCLLVEDTTGEAPAYGILKYPQFTFKIPYTPQLRKHLLTTLAHMRRAMKGGERHRSHEDAALCLRCGYRSICAEALGGTES